MIFNEILAFKNMFENEQVLDGLVYTLSTPHFLFPQLWIYPF